MDLLTDFPALIGTVEELAASQQTLNLVRDQFEINYFGPLNIIKAALPHMRNQKSGHIMILSGISEFYHHKFDPTDSCSCAYWHTGVGNVLCSRLGS